MRFKSYEQDVDRHNVQDEAHRGSPWQGTAVFWGIARNLLADNRRLVWLNTGLVFLFGLVALSRFTNAYVTSYAIDSFTMQYDSVRLLHGQVPYRDFFEFPTPGTFWLQALVFALFGTKSINAVYLLIVILAFLGAELYVLSFLLSGRQFASWFAPLFVLLGLTLHYPFPYHHWYAVTMATMTVLLMAGWLHRSSRWWLALAGMGCVLTGLFVQTQGMALVVAVSAFLTLTTAFEGHGYRRFGTMVTMRFLCFGSGIILTALPVILYFLFVGGLRQFIYDTVVWPSAHYSTLNDVPFMQDINIWIFWRFDNQFLVTSIPMTTQPMRFYSHLWITFGAIVIPLIVLLFSFVVILYRTVSAIYCSVRKCDLSLSRGAKQSCISGDLLLLCGLTDITLFGALIIGHNMGMIHMIWLTVITYPTLIGFIFAKHQDAGRDNTVATLSRTGPSMYSLYVLLASLIIAAGVWYQIMTTPKTTTSVDVLVSRQPLITYIREHTSSDDSIAMFTYGATAYFYGRPAAIGYTLLAPGTDYNTQAQFQEAADQVYSRRPRMVIFQPSYDWSTFFGFNPAVLQFAHDKYGAAQHLKTPEGEYLIYIRR